MAESMPIMPPWLTLKEACVYARVGHHTIRQLLNNGDLTGRRIGRKWIVSRQSIDDYLSEATRKVKVAVGEILR